MDKITIPVQGTDIKCDQFDQYTVLQGEYKIGNFTLIYYNLTTDPTSCNLMEHLTFTTVSPTQLSLSPDAVPCTCTCMSCISTQKGNT